MLLRNDWVKIMDFGIACLHRSSIRTPVGATMGKREYMSPEQAQGKPVDHRSDPYSLEERRGDDTTPFLPTRSVLVTRSAPAWTTRV